jgi:hypothetical protein
MSDMSTVVVIPTATACECTRASNGGPLHRDGVEVSGVYRILSGVSDSVLYSLQHGALFVTSFMFLMGLLFKVEGVSSSSGTYTAR